MKPDQRARAAPGGARTFEILGRLERRGPADRYLARVGDARAFVELLDDRWAAGSDAALRLEQDLGRLSGLGHPHLAVSTDLTRLAGRAAIVWPVEHEVAVSLLALPRWVAVAVAHRVADVLAAVAELGLCHGHLEPGAVTVDRSGRVRVHGCGIVHSDLPGWRPETRGIARGLLVPTPPEQLARARFVPTPEGDVYALGHLLATWWQGEGPGAARLRRQEHDEAVSQALATWADADPPGPGAEVRELVRRALAFDPRERPSAAELRDGWASLDLPGPSLGSWSEAHVPPSPPRARPDPDLTGPIVEAPWRAAPEAATEPVRRHRPLAPADPAATLEPLSEDGQQRWTTLREESLSALRAPTAEVPRPAAGRVSSLLGLAALGVVGFVGMGVIGAAAAAAWALWPRPEPGPTVEFRSALPDTETLTVRCGAIERSGGPQVTVPGTRLGRCTVTALDADRRSRTATVPDARGGRYVCFALDEDHCVEVPRH